jgi:hypothetical protein
MRFDPDHRFRPKESLAPIVSAEWWNGLLEHLRRGSRIVADPSTGLQVVPGTDNQTIALAGSYSEMWARAATPIGAPTGTNGAQMTPGTVRLWSTDSAGLRSDSGVDVVAFNGWVGETVPANAWIKVELQGSIWEVRNWECGA